MLDKVKASKWKAYQIFSLLNFTLDKLIADKS